jgi:hypothetical protein
MHLLSRLFDLATGRPLPAEAGGSASRAQLIVAALLALGVFAAAWGFAAGSQSLGLAMSNLYKVPMVVILSAVLTLPAGMLAWKLSEAPCRGRNILQAFVGGCFGGTLILAVLSPVVAVYYQSSAWAAPYLAIGSTFLAIAVGTAVFLRASVRAVDGKNGWRMAIPVSTFVVLQIALLAQLVSIASPILPERTVFADGVEAVAPDLPEPLLPHTGLTEAR